MQKKLKINKQNLNIDQIKYLTGLNLWNYGGICRAMMIRQQQQREETMTKKKITKKTKKKSKKPVEDFNKFFRKKIKEDFPGLKVKDIGDGMTEISFN